MSVPFNVILTAPNVLVLPIQGEWYLEGGNNEGTWAQVIQVNALNSWLNVGDIVFYNQQLYTKFFSSIDTEYYNIIDEKNILFKEEPFTYITMITESGDTLITESSDTIIMDV